MVSRLNLVHHLLLFVLFCFCVFDTGCHYVALAGLVVAKVMF